MARIARIIVALEVYRWIARRMGLLRLDPVRPIGPR